MAIYNDIATVIGNGGYDLADLLHRIDVIYVSGQLTEQEREDLYELARAGADPDDSLPDVTERVGAVEQRVAELEARVTAIEDGTMTPGSQEPPVEEEWPDWVKPTSKDTQYHKGDKVSFGGKHYVCDKNNVTASPAEDPKSWVEVNTSEGGDAKAPVWNAESKYKKGDVVTWPEDGPEYSCNKNNTKEEPGTGSDWSLV